MKKFLRKYDIKSIILVFVALFGPILIMGLVGFIGLLLKVMPNNFIFVLIIYFIIIMLEMAVIILESNANHRIKEKKKNGSWIAITGIVISSLSIIYYLVNAYSFIKGFY